jgi:hypothetical protein
MKVKLAACIMSTDDCTSLGLDRGFADHKLQASTLNEANQNHYGCDDQEDMDESAHGVRSRALAAACREFLLLRRTCTSHCRSITNRFKADS